MGVGDTLQTQPYYWIRDMIHAFLFSQTHRPRIPTSTFSAEEQPTKRAPTAGSVLGVFCLILALLGSALSFLSDGDLQVVAVHKPRWKGT